MTHSERELVAALRDTVGDDLRVVGSHDDDAWNATYVRDDLRDAYSTDSVNDIAVDLVFDSLGVDLQESLYKLGDLRATVRLFEDGIVVHVPVSDHDGYLVSLDDDASVRGRDVVQTVRDAT